MKFPTEVRLREVAPRDGFQSLERFVPTEQKIEIIEAVGRAGVAEVKATSFVSPRAVPQMRDAQVGSARGGMDRSMVGMLFSNIHTLISFQVSGEDARFLRDEFDGALEVADLTNLDRYAAYVKTSLNGVRLPVVQVHRVDRVGGCRHPGRHDDTLRIGNSRQVARNAGDGRPQIRETDAVG